MIIDNGIILASDEAPPNGGAVPGGLGADSVTLALDLSTTHPSVPGRIMGDILSDMELVIDITTSFVGAEPTTDADVTVSFNLVSMPIALSLLDDATTGKEMFIVECDTDITGGNIEDEIDLTAHGLVQGTPLFFDEVTTTTGVAIDTIYYVMGGAELLTNSFTVSTTRAGAIAGTGGVDMATGDGNVDIRFIPYIHASTGEIPFSCLQKGGQYVAKVNPYCTNVSPAPTVGSGHAHGTATAGELGWLPIPNRYLALQVLIANGGAGTVGRYNANLAVNGQAPLRHHPTATPIV